MNPFDGWTREQLEYLVIGVCVVIAAILLIAFVKLGEDVAIDGSDENNGDC